MDRNLSWMKNLKFTSVGQDARLYGTRDACRYGAAARSAITRAFSWRTRPAGIEGSARQSLANMAVFSDPVTNHRIRRERFKIG